jgi:iron complex transport system ATP-binding protein
MTASPLRAINLSIGYRAGRASCPVLEHLNLRVEAGEVVCLLGPNGIGKSTLLRTLATMQPPLSGTIEIDGCDARRLTRLDLARRLSVVLTDRLAVGTLASRHVVELGRYPYSGWLGTLAAADTRVVDWAIDAVGAAHLGARDFSTLSDGERQRILIARALAQQPVVMLLDEPTAFLDAPSRVDVMGLLRQLARDQGLAVVLATHELDLALRTADTVWLVTPTRELRVASPSTLVPDADGDPLDAVVSLLRPVGGRGSAVAQPSRTVGRTGGRS